MINGAYYKVPHKRTSLQKPQKWLILSYESYRYVYLVLYIHDFEDGTLAREQIERLHCLIRFFGGEGKNG